MVDQRIVDYIKNGLSNGYKPDDLREALLKQGWPDGEVEEAFGLLKKPDPMPEVKPANTGFFSKFRMAITSPGKLFEAVKNEHDLNSAVKYYAVISLIPIIISLIIVFLHLAFIASIVPIVSLLLGPLSVLLLMFEILGTMAIASMYFLGILASFSFAGFFHIFAMMMRSEKNGFAQTYKSLSYATPVSVIGFIVFVILNFVIPGQTLVLSAVVLFFIAWYLAVSIVGLSHLHGISKGRAAAFIILPVVIVVTAIILIQYVLLPIFMQTLMAELFGGFLGGAG